MLAFEFWMLAFEFWRFVKEVCIMPVINNGQSLQEEGDAI
jgi:hypothetical protein